MSGLVSLEQMTERSRQLLALSGADATSIAWVETREGEVVESARGRRSGIEERRSVLIRVRVGGRTGRSRAESERPGDLQRSLRAALADARCAEPSPEWDLAATQREPEAIAGDLFDDAISRLEPHQAQEELQRRATRRSSLRLRWRECRLTVVASFHSPRALATTDATFEARTGRRPGSGFVARSARLLDELSLDTLVDEARGREAAAIDNDPPPGAVPIVLSAEAVAVLLDALGRRALAAASAAGDGGWRGAPILQLIDDPLAGEGLPTPFDFDGCAKSRRDFVRDGLVVARASDLDLAARLGEPPTGHALAGDDAWPDHLVLPAGETTEEELLRRAAGGLRIGALEQLAVGPGEAALPLRTVARNVRRIGDDGTLGNGLAPLTWTTSLGEIFGALVATADAPIVWSARRGSTGAVRTPAVALTALDGFAVRRS